MTKQSYARPPGGLPLQSELLTGRSVCSNFYIVIPRQVMRDIVISLLPHWEKTISWILSRPLTGFSETFSHYIMEVEPGGGSEFPEPDKEVESVIFVTHGSCTISIDSNSHWMGPGSYGYLPSNCRWTLRSDGEENCVFHWIRKRYEVVNDFPAPEPFFKNETEIIPQVMPHTEGRWSTTRFVEPDDLRHDMHVNIVNFEPGATIPFLETHVMEHGLYILEGKAAYRLNQDWVEVEAGDYIWLRAFCPQACYAGGPNRFRYLLYKDVNRHARLWPHT